MAIVRRNMTPEQFNALIADIERQLEYVRPVMEKFGRRYQKALRRNIRTGKNATGETMDPLTGATFNSIVTDDAKPSYREKQLRRRSDYGHIPMNATGEMAKGFVYKLIHNGFVLMHRSKKKQDVVDYHLKPVDIRVTPAMSRHLAAKHDIKVKPSTTLHRPERIPFALNSRMIKRSVGDLNKHIFKKLFR